MFTAIVLSRHDMRLEYQGDQDVPITKGWDLKFLDGYTNHGTLTDIPIRHVTKLLALFPGVEIRVPDRYAMEWLERKGIKLIRIV